MAQNKAGAILGARSAEMREDEAKALEMLRKEADERGMTMSEVAQVAVDNLALEDELITVTKMADREKKYVHTEEWEEDQGTMIRGVVIGRDDRFHLGRELDHLSGETRQYSTQSFSTVDEAKDYISIYRDQGQPGLDRALAERENAQMNRDEHDQEDDNPTIVHSERWRFGDDASVEIRNVVVESSAGFHPGYETSYMGGEGDVSFSGVAFDNFDKARHLAWSYAEGGEDSLKVAANVFDAAAQSIKDLTAKEELSIGERTILHDALFEVQARPAEITTGKTDSLQAITRDPEEIGRIANVISDPAQSVDFVKLRDDARLAGFDALSAAGIDAFVDERYGSQEAFIETNNVRARLQEFSSAGRVGASPALSDEQADEFRAGVDQAYGVGVFDRLKTGDTHSIASDFPLDPQRRWIANAVEQFEDSSRSMSAEERQDRLDAHTLAERIRSADWYYDYSDDSSVRISGAAEVRQVEQDVAQFAAKSSYHAEWISAAWDEGTPPYQRSTFEGYVDPTDRVAVRGETMTFGLSAELKEVAMEDRFELRDPFMEATHHFEAAEDAITKADELGSTRFQHVQDDGSVKQVKKVEGTWVRDDGEPVEGLAGKTSGNERVSANEQGLHQGTEAGFNPLDEKHLSDLETLRHAIRGARNLDDGEHSVDIAKSAFKEFSQKSNDHAEIASFLWDKTLRDSGVNAGDGYVPEHYRGLTKVQHQLMVNDIDRRKNLAEIEHDSKASESSTIVEMLQVAKTKLNSFRENFQRLPDRSPEGHEPERRHERTERDLEL